MDNYIKNLEYAYEELQQRLAAIETMNVWANYRILNKLTFYYNLIHETPNGTETRDISKAYAHFYIALLKHATWEQAIAEITNTKDAYLIKIDLRASRGRLQPSIYNAVLEYKKDARRMYVI